MGTIINLKKQTKEEPATPVLKPKHKRKLFKKKPDLNSIQWKAYEFEQYEKDQSWVTVSGFIAFVVFMIALLTKNYLLMIFLVISYFTLLSYAFKKPRKMEFAVTPKGVIVDKTLHQFEDLSSFWISYNPPGIKELSLRSRKKLMPYITIPLEQQNPVAVRTVLAKYLPERKHKESITDNVFKGLGY